MGMLGPEWTWISSDAATGLSYDAVTMESLVGTVGVLPRKPSGPVWQAFLASNINHQVFGDSDIPFMAQMMDSLIAIFEAAKRGLEHRVVTSSSQPQDVRHGILQELRQMNSPEGGFDGLIGERVFFDGHQVAADCI